MVPLLFGRIQTRIFLLVLLGGIWTALVTPFLPRLGGLTLSEKYQATYTVLGLVLGLGIIWEFIYHGLMQFRWEKDWPTLFGFITMVNEGLVVWLLISTGRVANLEGGVPGVTFLVHFVTTWLVVFVFVNGPMRVPFLRWRFRGGRLI